MKGRTHENVQVLQQSDAVAARPTASTSVSAAKAHDDGRNTVGKRAGSGPATPTHLALGVERNGSAPIKNEEQPSRLHGKAGKLQTSSSTASIGGSKERSGALGADMLAGSDVELMTADWRTTHSIAAGDDFIDSALQHSLEGLAGQRGAARMTVLSAELQESERRRREQTVELTALHALIDNLERTRSSSPKKHDARRAEQRASAEREAERHVKSEVAAAADRIWDLEGSVKIEMQQESARTAKHLDAVNERVDMLHGTIASAHSSIAELQCNLAAVHGGLQADISSLAQQVQLACSAITKLTHTLVKQEERSPAALQPRASKSKLKIASAGAGRGSSGSSSTSESDSSFRRRLQATFVPKATPQRSDRTAAGAASSGKRATDAAHDSRSAAASARAMHDGTTAPARTASAAAARTTPVAAAAAKHGKQRAQRGDSSSDGDHFERRLRKAGWRRCSSSEGSDHDRHGSHTGAVVLPKQRAASAPYAAADVMIVVPNVVSFQAPEDHATDPAWCARQLEVIHDIIRQQAVIALNRARRALPPEGSGMWGVQWHAPLLAYMAASLQSSKVKHPRADQFVASKLQWKTDATSKLQAGHTDDDVWTWLTGEIVRVFMDRNPRDFTTMLSTFTVPTDMPIRDATTQLSRFVNTAVTAQSNTAHGQLYDEMRKDAIISFMQRQFPACGIIAALQARLEDRSYTSLNMCNDVNIYVRDLNLTAKAPVDRMFRVTDGVRAKSGSGKQEHSDDDQRRKQREKTERGQRSAVYMAALEEIAAIDGTAPGCRNCSEAGHQWIQCPKPYQAERWKQWLADNKGAPYYDKQPRNEQWFNDAQQRFRNRSQQQRGGGRRK